MSTLRAVVFDFYGTLTAGRSAAAQAEARKAQADALGVEVAPFDAELTATVDERFRGAGRDAADPVAGSLAWVAARLGARPDAATLARAAAIRLTAERRFGEPRQEAVEVLRTLHEHGLRIGLVSDCSAELPTYFADLPVAPYIDAPVFSFMTGYRKPAPEIYLACCDALGVEPSECLYVGDGGSNELPGARAVGMRPVHLAVADEAQNVVYGRHEAWDGETITSLTEVPTLALG
jgi:putative hydrolase of the HAD superfamily